MAGKDDDVRLPFSTLDPMIGDVFATYWEPEMMEEMGNALRILTSEVLTTVGQTVLSATVLTAVLSALQWPLSKFRCCLLRIWMRSTNHDFCVFIYTDNILGSSHQAKLSDRQVSRCELFLLLLSCLILLQLIFILFPVFSHG